MQCMHIGSYDDKHATIQAMENYALKNGHELDFLKRQHHKIYPSDPRKCDINKMKTVLRHPKSINAV